MSDGGRVTIERWALKRLLWLTQGDEVRDWCPHCQKLHCYQAHDHYCPIAAARRALSAEPAEEPPCA